jgi:hypothetical protein
MIAKVRICIGGVGLARFLRVFGGVALSFLVILSLRVTGRYECRAVDDAESHCARPRSWHPDTFFSSSIVSPTRAVLHSLAIRLIPMSFLRFSCPALVSTSAGFY